MQKKKLSDFIEGHEDFPKKGIFFRDVLPEYEGKTMWEGADEDAEVKRWIPRFESEEFKELYGNITTGAFVDEEGWQLAFEIYNRAPAAPAADDVDFIITDEQSNIWAVVSNQDGDTIYTFNGNPSVSST
mgnify:CR=1 FL=1